MEDALKPILEKISVDKLGHYYFSFLRYLISGIIAVPFLIHHYYFYRNLNQIHLLLDLIS